MRTWIKIIISMLIVFNASLVFAWPINMYTIEKLYVEQFSALRTYINTIEREYANRRQGDQLIFLSQDNFAREIFRLQVQRFTSDNYIREEILFKSIEHTSEKFIFERWGSNLQPTPFWELVRFNFKYPSTCARFRIEFVQNMIAQTVLINTNESFSNYRLFDYTLEIHHHQWQEQDRMISKLYYQCDVCSGDPLMAIMDTRPTHFGNMYYFLGNPLLEMTPAMFYMRAGRSYLSGIQREFNDIPIMGQALYGWPNPN
jgi:hypothetical protein